jgi:hypothetical protein
MRRWWLAAWAIALSCSAPATERPPSPPRAVNELLRYDYLVWKVDRQPETIWYDAEGREVARARGLLIALRGTLYRLDTHLVDGEATGCEGPAGPARDTVLELVSLADPEDVQRVSYHAASGWGRRRGAHRAAVTAGVGRYLLVTERLDREDCDGRTATEAYAYTYDVVRGDWLEPLIDADTEDALRPRALRTLTAQIIGAGAGKPDDTAWHGDTRLAWAGDRLDVEYLFWVGTDCPSCGDGTWSSGARALWLSAPSLPAALDDELDGVPAQLVRRVAGSPAGISWGIADRHWRRVFGGPGKARPPDRREPRPDARGEGGYRVPTYATSASSGGH